MSEETRKPFFGKELLNEFKERQAKIRPAVEVLQERAGDAGVDVVILAGTRENFYDELKQYWV